MNIQFDNIPWKKIGSIAATVVTVVSAAAGALSDKQKAMEFEQMKKDIENLKNSQ